MSANKKACITCSQEFTGDDAVCPKDGTILTPLMQDRYLGTVLAGRYEIIEVIGGGGMGLVYKARHNMMNRIVAIKMLHSHLTNSAEALKRFQLEAQAASCLSVPSILTIFDFGVSEEGQPYMVMDYLEGTSLADVLEAEGRLPILRSLGIFIQACAGLAHAHQKGVIHRDLKPSNIMLVNYADDQADFVKIVDFGIAKLLNRTGDDAAANLTRTGEVYGSPLYMSPEQCRGQELDARSDLYSFGCVMYKTVTGQPVFTGSEMIELLFKQVSEMPRHFADACPDEELPAEFEAIVFKSIAKTPNNRYESMAELKDVLEAYKRKLEGADGDQPGAPNAVQGASALASGVGRLPRVTGPLANAMAHKHAPAAQALGTVDHAAPAPQPAAAQSAAASATRQSASHAQPPSTPAAVAATAASSAAAAAMAIKKESSGTFPPVQDPQPEKPNEKEDPKRAATNENERASSQTPVMLREQKGGLKQTANAKPDWVLMSIMHNPVILAAVVVLVIATAAVAFLALRGKTPLTLNGGNQAVEPRDVSSLETLAELAMKANDPAQAIEQYKHAQQIEQAAAGENNPIMAKLSDKLAQAYIQTEDYKSAETQISKSVAIREKLNDETLAMAESLTIRGDVYSHQGLNSQAEPDLRKALAIEQKLGTPDPRTKKLLDKVAGETKTTTTTGTPTTTTTTSTPATTVTSTQTSAEQPATTTGTGTETATQGAKPLPGKTITPAGTPPSTAKPETAVKQPPQTTVKTTSPSKPSSATEKPAAQHKVRPPHHAARPTSEPIHPAHRHAYSSYGN